MMQAMPYNLQQGKGVVEISQISANWNSLDKFQHQENNTSKSGNKNNNFSSSRTTSSIESEPTSTLDTSGIGLEEWDSLFPNGDGSLLPWIMGDPDDPGSGLKHSGNPSMAADFEGTAGLGVVDQQPNHVEGDGFEGNIKIVNGGGGGGSIPPNGFNFSHLLGCGDEKPQIFNPQLGMNQQQAHTCAIIPAAMHRIPSEQQGHNIASPSFPLPYSTLGDYCHQLDQFQPQLKRHNPGLLVPNPFLDPGLQEQGVKDEVFKAANLIQTGNFSFAQEILARLNQHLSLPAKPPLIRAALYVKEALQMLLRLSNPVAKMVTPYDVVHKMDAYKVFSEVSPITQFVNFTCTQAILESLDDDIAIHIVDFDIGCGAQWASLIQELPLRKRGAPSLHITAVAPSSTHPFELALIRENLVQFANDNGVPFEFQVVNFDSFDLSSSSFPGFRTSKDESIAVSIPIWSSSTRPSILPSILRFIKQLSPKIVLSLDRGFDRCDVPFPQHVIHSLESLTNFMESLDGLNVASHIVSKIEKYFVQPRIENAVMGRLHSPEKMPHWKNLFASAGLMPVQFSNFTETQADYVVKRTPRPGFHVEKRQASLVLSWQRRELVAALAWRC